MTRSFSLKDTVVPFFSLFASTGTLVCCALPAIMVSIGAGAALAGLTSEFPALVFLSRHKVAVFSLAALMIAAAGAGLWRARSLPCPADARLARACGRLRTFSWMVWALSVLCFSTGFFFAFLAPYLLEK